MLSDEPLYPPCAVNGYLSCGTFVPWRALEGVETRDGGFLIGELPRCRAGENPRRSCPEGRRGFWRMRTEDDRLRLRNQDLHYRARTKEVP